MVKRALALVTVAALTGPAAYAGSAGVNVGIAGIVADQQVVGGITFTGTCEFAVVISGRITQTTAYGGEAIAVANPPVQLTTITCTVVQLSRAHVSTATMTGPVAVTASAYQTAEVTSFVATVCIQMSSGPVSTEPRCEDAGLPR
jgi:hypothetical protein